MAALNADTCGLGLFVMLIDKNEMMVLACQCHVCRPRFSIDTIFQFFCLITNKNNLTDVHSGLAPHLAPRIMMSFLKLYIKILTFHSQVVKSLQMSIKNCLVWEKI